MNVLSQHWRSGDTKLINDLSEQLAKGGTFTINSEGATPSGTQEESKPPIINYNITMPPSLNNNNNNNNNGNISYVAFSERKASVETFPMFKGNSEIEWRKYWKQYESVALKGIDPDSHRVIQELGKKLMGVTREAFDRMYKHGQKYKDITDKISNFLKMECAGVVENKIVIYENLIRGQGELWSLYAYRLQDAFSEAYPMADVQSDERLLNRLLREIPSGIRNYIEEKLHDAYVVGSVKGMKWNYAVQYLGSETRRLKPHLFKENAPNTNAYSGPPVNNNANNNPRLAPNYNNAGNGWRNPQRAVSNQATVTTQQPQNNPKGSNMKISDGRSKDGIIVCGFCNKLYHSYNDCWRYRGLCLICGEKHLMKDCPKYSPAKARFSPNNVSNGKNYKISQPSSDGFRKVYNKINKGISPKGGNNNNFNIKVSNRYQALQNTIPKVWQPRGGRNGGGAWVPKTQGVINVGKAGNINNRGISSKKHIKAKSQLKNANAPNKLPKNAETAENKGLPKYGRTKGEILCKRRGGRYFSGIHENPTKGGGG
ncbi:unnamed protein product [Rotaria magnacalcarata]|uniref:Uncharacterized protein n=1 Tax=Rotaria magnacalcarata TaxID=392030 RepID=A0A816U5F1_9BILA|nr:unnamed protein product [Rotaria magnacalcarata]